MAHNYCWHCMSDFASPTRLAFHQAVKGRGAMSDAEISAIFHIRCEDDFSPLNRDIVPVLRPYKQDLAFLIQAGSLAPDYSEFISDRMLTEEGRNGAVGKDPISRNYAVLYRWLYGPPLNIDDLDAWVTDLLADLENQAEHFFLSLRDISRRRTASLGMGILGPLAD